MVSSPNLSAATTTRGRVAYVLDDEVQIGAFVCEVLIASGFEARQFADPIAFLAAVKANAPQLTIVDLALGHSDAVEVIRQLETVRFQGGVLLMSGRDEGTLAEIKQIGDRHGFAMLSPLKKPFRACDLRRRLADFDADGNRRAAKAQPPSSNQESLDASRHRLVDLSEALASDWLQLWYQPKIDLNAFSVCGGEALLRARHPEFGLLTPAHLLPPAGDPRYQALSRFVIERAVKDWGLLADQGSAIKLSVNVPVSVALVPNFISFVRGALPVDSRFPGLIIEITEDEIIQDRDWVH